MLYVGVCQDKDTACGFRPQIAALSRAGKPVLINICLSPLTKAQTRPLCRIFLFVSVSLFLSCIYILQRAFVLINKDSIICYSVESSMIVWWEFVLFQQINIFFCSNFIVTMACQAPKSQPSKQTLTNAFEANVVTILNMRNEKNNSINSTNFIERSTRSRAIKMKREKTFNSVG